MIMLRTAILLAISAALATAQTTGTEQTDIVTSLVPNTTVMNNMTTMANKMTTMANKMTTMANNMTTMANNMTTMPMTTSTPDPTPCSYTKWLVRETGGDICMLMDFSGTITYYQGPNTFEASIGDKITSIQLSTCNDTVAKFDVAFVSNNVIWILSLYFTSNENTYVMDTVGMTLATLEGSIFVSESFSTEFFTVDNGQYYICDTFETSVIDFDVNLTNPIFQPFVQKTSEGCGLGLANECGNGESGTSTGLIVGCVFGAIIVLAAAGGVTYYIIRKKKNNNSYSNM